MTLISHLHRVAIVAVIAIVLAGCKSEDATTPEVMTAASPASATSTPAQLTQLKQLWKDGVAAKQKGDYAGAKQAWQKALALAPGHPGFQEAIDKLLAPSQAPPSNASTLTEISLETALKSKWVTMSAHWGEVENPGLYLDLKRTLNRPLRVQVPPGVVVDFGHHDSHVNTLSIDVDLSRNPSASEFLVTQDMYLNSDYVPSGGNAPPKVYLLSPQSPVRKVAEALDRDTQVLGADTHPAVHAFAIWAVSVNPTRRQLRSYQMVDISEFDKSPWEMKGKRADTPEVMEAVKDILRSAGISPASRRMFRSRR